MTDHRPAANDTRTDTWLFRADGDAFEPGDWLPLQTDRK